MTIVAKKKTGTSECHTHCRHKGVVSQCQVHGRSNTHKVPIQTLIGSEALDISSNNSYSLLSCHEFLVQRSQSRGAYRVPSLFRHMISLDRSPAWSTMTMSAIGCPFICCNHQLRHLWAVESMALRFPVVARPWGRQRSSCRCLHYYI